MTFFSLLLHVISLVDSIDTYGSRLHIPTSLFLKAIPLGFHNLGYTFLHPQFDCTSPGDTLLSRPTCHGHGNDSSSQTRHDPETARMARLAALEGRTGGSGGGGRGGEAAAPLLAASDHDVLTLQVK